MHTKGRDDFDQFIQEYLRLLLLFEHENDVVCIFQIDKVYFTGYLNTRVLETLQSSSHYFIDYEVRKEWGECASLTDTALLAESSPYTLTRPEGCEYEEPIMFTNFRGIPWARPDRRKSTSAQSDASPRSPWLRHVRKTSFAAGYASQSNKWEMMRRATSPECFWNVRKFVRKLAGAEAAEQFLNTQKMDKRFTKGLIILLFLMSLDSVICIRVLGQLGNFRYAGESTVYPELPVEAADQPEQSLPVLWTSKRGHIRVGRGMAFKPGKTDLWYRHILFTRDKSSGIVLVDLGINAQILSAAKAQLGDGLALVRRRMDNGEHLLQMCGDHRWFLCSTMFRNSGNRLTT
ncbi:hypothetical protein T265_05911 [Opisthorchis viverrini]|uniref:Uncharacterized protein n=1 Tax=Opisthorchis viverrini TaxID=6198 RepID=A0A075AEP3_OPIVI|nr:hypothetical protein T265_05911 [Opisthorchis viverrini]KER26924.1 hypothetical protein T265_05911 [Opisthorchis viverrini]